jgi:hypothetical protein
VPPGYVWNKSTDKRVSLGTPATAVEPRTGYMLMKNLWYNNGRCAPWTTPLLSDYFTASPLASTMTISRLHLQAMEML